MVVVEHKQEEEEEEDQGISGVIGNGFAKQKVTVQKASTHNTHWYNCFATITTRNYYTTKHSHHFTTFPRLGNATFLEFIALLAG